MPLTKWKANGKARVNFKVDKPTVPRCIASIALTRELAPSGQTRAAVAKIAAYPVKAIPVPR